MKIETYLEERRLLVESALQSVVPEPAGPAARLMESVRYALFGGGKRLRPVLAVAVCEACGGRAEDVLEPAVALEMIHTYSLVHDDLPAMDDDDLRRGRPTTHKAYDEATAVLAGDALLTLAFELLATRPAAASAERRAEAVGLVARRAGWAGMVGGQMADLVAEGSPADRDTLGWIHAHKTGALLGASAELGALYGGAAPADRLALALYGEALGLAFQIADDLLDRTANAGTLGKTPGKDAASGKLTFPGLIGVEASRAEARRMVHVAIAAIPSTVGRREILDALARYAADRSH